MGFEYLRRMQAGSETQAAEEALAEEVGASTDGCLDCCAPIDFFEAGAFALACVLCVDFRATFESKVP